MPNLPDFSDPVIFTWTVLLLTVIINIRYLLIAGLFHFIFNVWQAGKWQSQKLHAPIGNDQFRREVLQSLVCGFIFAVGGGLTLLFWQLGWTRVYTNINQFGWFYLPLSFFILLILHEWCYYWLHRWMHRPGIFKIVHKVHHESKIPSPWTAFSFHPLEAIIISLILPAILMILPLHPIVIVAQLVWMSITGVINHLDIEIFSKRFYKSFVGRLMIGATHHSMHHGHSKFNFGLYFTIFDKIHQTEHPEYKSSSIDGS